MDTTPLAVPSDATRAMASSMSVSDETVRAVAAPVVAAELRRLADEAQADVPASFDARALMRDRLRTRAAEIERARGGEDQ